MVVLSQLSEGSSSSSSTHNHKYDVFLSFRGVDTRLNFIDHLYKALLIANITTFLDEEEIETGLSLKPELESAIKASRASIIVLSENYASSTWCLNELVLILEQHRASNHIVIPIFYHVDPTNVRKQKSSFGDAMKKYKQRMETETDAEKRSQLALKMEKWKKALTEVADLKGKDAKGWRETKFIEEIVMDIYHRLGVHLRSALPLLCGMEDSSRFITSWLKDVSLHTADILTIFGMGGIGKTTLARYVYGLSCHLFASSSFIEGINEKSDAQVNGLLYLQKQLFDDISKTSLIQAHDGYKYTSMIESALSRQKVFIVLDDIGSLKQLDALLGNKGFHPGSKIIITTKDASLTQSCALFNSIVQPNHIMHELRGLHRTNSLELLSLHAFKGNRPKKGYEEVSEKLVEYCGGLPLALEVLGKSLCNKKVAAWEDCIEGLKKEAVSHVNKVLQMSFDSLPSENDKELFKHIACFFVGKDRGFMEAILNKCGIRTVLGVRNLIDRCLLRIGRHNELMMHQLLQNMGREVVRQESLKKPWKRSRLWCHEESFKVLKQKKGKENLLGLVLDMKMLEKDKLYGSLELKTDALSKMDNLMLLQLNYVQLDGSYKNFPEELRWLCMHGFPLEYIPSNLPVENLVALDMSYSNFKSFDMSYGDVQQHGEMQRLTESCSKDRRLLRSLKILNLSFCKQLRSIGGFFELPALERLILANCISLIEICESIEQCDELVHVDLSYCNMLQNLPRIVLQLKKAETLSLDGYDLSNFQIEMRDMDSPKMINTINNGINSQTSSSNIVKAASIDFLPFVISLPSSLVRLSLKDNNLSNESFPMDLSSLSMLKELYLDGNSIVSLPNCVGSLPRLEKLSIRKCLMLTTIEQPPHILRSLKNLNLSFCKQLRSVGGFSKFPALERLILESCISLTEVCKSIEQCDGLEVIDMSDCNEVGKLLGSISKLKNLKQLMLNNVKAIPRASRASRTSVISSLGSLVSLLLQGNNLSNESFPMDMSSLSMLKELYLDGNDIVSLPNCVRTLPRLEKLSITHCDRLKTLEHPPRTLKELIFGFSDDNKKGKVVFDPEMSPIMLSTDDRILRFCIEGMLKVEDMADVGEKVLCSLGWTDLVFTKIQPTGSKVQMVYEFGIFSIFYVGQEIPNWISDRREGSSISLTIPSSPNNLRGLNICYVFTATRGGIYFFVDIMISNITKNRTWIYTYPVVFQQTREGIIIYLSHWMFGKNEMEGGDEVTISILKTNASHISIRECGVSVVYDDDVKNKMEEEEEEDVLGYYKSWDHILGMDLPHFQTTTLGEYSLDNSRFFRSDVFRGSSLLSR